MLLVLVFACCAKASDALLICSTLVGIVSSSQLLLLIVSCPFVVVLHSIPPSEDLLVLVYGGEGTREARQLTGSWRRNRPDRGTNYSTEQQPVGYC